MHRVDTHCANGLQRASTLILPFMSSIMFQYFLRSPCAIKLPKTEREEVCHSSWRYGTLQTLKTQRFQRACRLLTGKPTE